VAQDERRGSAARFGRGAPVRRDDRVLGPRPWAQIWEKYFEQRMQKPAKDDIFKFD
jgi:hypothetical protein